MGRTRTIIAAAIVSAIILSILAVGPVFSAEAQVFASVDVERAFDEYQKKQELDKQMMADLQVMQSKFELRQVHQLLSKTEFDELATLKAKAKPTEADTKRTGELEAASSQREQELQTLRQKTTPTDAEKTRMAALQDQVKQTGTELKEMDKQASMDLQKRQYELSKQVMDDVQAAVAAVAKQKGITMVFNKTIGSAIMVVFSTTDITDEVLKKLNKK